ncbi:MAG: glycosyltransferase family 39 protein [Anaerolineaceae bacterium]|nr:glycosyltransferase family 39 protein [Anaerolineaceae bacterium]
MTTEDSQPLPSGETAPAGAPENAHVELSIDIQPGMQVQVLIVSGRAGEKPQIITQTALPAQAGSPSPIKTAPRFRERAPPFLRRWAQHARTLAQNRAAAGWLTNSRLLFALCLLFYVLIQFTGLGVYPAHFSYGEAVSIVNAAVLVRNDMHGAQQDLLPTFTKNNSQYDQSATVYLAVIPYLLFGKSVIVARAVTALIALLGAVWFALFLRDFLHLREWWLGPLLLALTPAWFFLARTGLETAQMAAFSIGFWYYYAVYRDRNARFLYPALILGGLVFYTYTPGQIIIVVTGLILLAVDWRYHWQQRKTTWKGLLVLLLLAAPLVRFFVQQPEAYLDRLYMYNSYLVWPNLTVLQKAGRYLLEYLRGLSPIFWLSPHTDGQRIRYAFGGLPPLPWLYAPLIVLGLYTGIRRWRAAPAVRLAFYALLAAPAGAAVIIGGTLPRRLAVVFPLVLFAALGLSTALEWVEARRPWLRRWSNLTLLVFFAASGIFAMLDANTNGARWLPNYGLDGLQWGAPQVYSAARGYALQHPDTVVLVSPNWTSQGQTLRDFFAEDYPNIQVQGAGDFIGTYHEEISTYVFVLTPEDLSQVRQSGKFKPPEVLQVIPYPDGRDGFYFVRLAYVEDISAILKAERAGRRKLLTETVLLDGEEAEAQYSTLDMGPVGNVFDNVPDT